MCKMIAADMTGLLDLVAGTPDVPETDDMPLETLRPMPTLREVVLQWQARHRRAPRFLWAAAQ